MLPIQTGLDRHECIYGFIIYLINNGQLRQFRFCCHAFFRLSPGIRLYHLQKHFTLECCRSFFRCSKVNIHHIHKGLPNFKRGNIDKTVNYGLSAFHGIDKTCNILIILALGRCKPRILPDTFQCHFPVDLTFDARNAAYLCFICMSA